MALKKKSYVTGSAEETADLGAILSENLKPGASVALIGELGAGKTQFARGIARGLGIEGSVTSPSYTIINTYGEAIKLNHIDLYRIGEAGELDELGLEEYIYSSGITVIEWAEKAPEYLEDMKFVVRFSHVSESERAIEIEERD
ncbi:MAG: tRNA (adenosine(37)-N6)-threonylcarbamoyltransferase complex ATPase subunit type 1 TsaE [Thermodesulfobacteriota bacterium]